MKRSTDEGLLPASGPTAPAKPRTFGSYFLQGLYKTAFPIFMFYYVTASQHGFAGLMCSKKDFCNPIRCARARVFAVCGGSGSGLGFLPPAAN
jgi:hypothetical protein